MNSLHENKIPILSFYSGGGFLDMGFEMAGFEIIWTNEYDEVFAKLHAAGITSWRKSRGNGIKAEIFNTKSIARIESSEILREAFKGTKPPVFGIIGGPPCQDFSVNGSRKGFRGSRGKLTILYLKKILELRPSFFVMENVKGLLMKHKTYLLKLLERVSKDYEIDYKVLNALEFGVPQFRERIFLIGIRKSLMANSPTKAKTGETWFPWPLDKSYEKAATKFQWPSASKFGGKVTRHRDIPLELCVKSCLVPDNKFNSIPNSNEFFKLYGKVQVLNKIKEGETNRPSFKRLHRFKFSPTACYGNNEVHLHPSKNRRISVREALRIQGVSDEYVLPKKLGTEQYLSKKFKMIGNGVPVPLAHAVANALRQFIGQLSI